VGLDATHSKDRLDARRASFKSMGEDYELTRPQYPVDVIGWIVGPEPRDVLDLGCGSGKLTSQLAGMGHRVVGVDPSMMMLQGMPAKDLPAICGTAEAVPLKTESVDVVTAAQAFHWFDHTLAIPEIRRVLRRDGRLGLMWNLRDESVDWVRDLSKIIGSEDAMAATLGGPDAAEGDLRTRLQHAAQFTSIEREVFPFKQELSESGLVGLIRSRSYVAILPEGERQVLLTAVAELCRNHPQLKGKPKFTLPYKTLAFRASSV
jgi:SAM-dependent methyltransferase